MKETTTKVTVTGFYPAHAALTDFVRSPVEGSQSKFYWTAFAEIFFQLSRESERTYSGSRTCDQRARTYGAPGTT